MHHHVLVPVRVGDRPTLFLLDSGASADGLSPAFASSLQLAGIGKAEAIGAGGRVGDEQVVEAPEFAVGSTRIAPHRVTVVDFAPDEPSVGGIFGRDFLLLHDTEIDLARGRLRLFPAGSSRVRTDLAPSAFARVPFEDAMGLPRVRARLDDSEPLPAIVDFGATNSIVSAEAARRAGFTPPDIPGRAAAIGADGRPIAVAQHVFTSVRIGELVVAKPNLVVGDLPVFETLGLGKGPAMLLGLDLLEGRTVVVDYSNHEVVLSR